jgi:c-di-GMP-binding flagellar brake protein YcgR
MATTERKKRKHSRIPITILCDIFVSDSKIPEGRGCIVNFSLGGVAVVTRLDFAPDTEIRMQLNFNNEQLDISSTVAHGRAVMGDVFIYGVRYVRLNLFRKFKLNRKLKKWVKTHRK